MGIVSCVELRALCHKYPVIVASSRLALKLPAPWSPQNQTSGASDFSHSIDPKRERTDRLRGQPSSLPASRIKQIKSKFAFRQARSTRPQKRGSPTGLGENILGTETKSRCPPRPPILIPTIQSSPPRKLYNNSNHSRHSLINNYSLSKFSRRKTCTKRQTFLVAHKTLTLSVVTVGYLQPTNFYTLTTSTSTTQDEGSV